MSKLIIPKGYEPVLDLRDTEKAIRLIKEYFQVNLAAELNLFRVTAPLFVKSGTGINDNLNGTENPVSFKVKDVDNCDAEIVHSLAKWKRMALKDYGFYPGEGLYTDMNAIRTDEELDNLHSIYVDQWDWERAISAKERSLDFLKYIVRKIYKALKKAERYVFQEYPDIEPILPKEIKFLFTEELEEKYPELSPKERENKVTEEYGAVFLMGIGNALKNGLPHDGRSPDYDDWSTENSAGYKGLNGDILVWHPILEQAFELSSMGIRVDKKSLLHQLELQNALERKELFYHKMLLNDELPLSIGGGIGQSRLCMFLLRKIHIGEVQSSIWPEDMIHKCHESKIFLL